MMQGQLSFLQNDMFLDLNQFTRRLSVVVKSDSSKIHEDSGSGSSETSATGEEAQLLMNLSSPKPNRVNCSPSSFCLDPLEHKNPNFTGRDSNHADDVFYFRCPSLSIVTDEPNCPTLMQNVKTNGDDDAIPSTRNIHTTRCTLYKLLQRHIRYCSTWKDVDTYAYDIAENLLNSFGMIVENQIQSWINSISAYIDLQRICDDEKHKEKKQDSSKHHVRDVLGAILSQFYVAELRTSFRTFSNIDMQPLKKKQKIIGCDKTIKFFHKIEREIELIATITVAPYNITSIIHVPGTIIGDFEIDCDDRISSRFKGTELSLDIGFLVEQLMKQSRYVARKAAEIEILCGSNENIRSCDLIPRCIHSSTTEDKITDQTSSSEVCLHSDITESTPMMSPRKSSDKYMPSTPCNRIKSSGPSFVSPAASTASLEERCSFDVKKRDIGSNCEPSLPILVQVACASFAKEKIVSLPIS